MNTLIYNARVAGATQADTYLAIDGDTIAAIGHGQPCHCGFDTCIDAEGALLMPGAIDCHVHFREPGLTYKADIHSESRAAIAGGVTSYFDMPNTRPATTTIEQWEQKREIAREHSAANYAFFIGATNDNVDELRQADYTQVPGVKLFMGSSTGNMLVDSDDAISRIFSEVDAIVAVHAEDQHVIDANAAAARAAYPEGQVPVSMHTAIRSVEACYRSTQHAVELAKRHGRRLHVCHLTTARELELLQPDVPISEKLITSEVSPHHLLWCDADYATKGTRIKMNPSVKSAADRDALRAALEQGLIDMVATDHAPHLLQDKEGDAFTAASGSPLVQFSLPLMLTLFPEELVQRVMCHNPAEVYRIHRRGTLAVGNYADLVLVRPVQPYAITDADVVSKCGWTPLDGVELTYKVEKTWVNGMLAYDHGRLADNLYSKPLKFDINE